MIEGLQWPASVEFRDVRGKLVRIVPAAEAKDFVATGRGEVNQRRGRVRYISVLWAQVQPRIHIQPTIRDLRAPCNFTVQKDGPLNYRHTKQCLNYENAAIRSRPRGAEELQRMQAEKAA